VEKQVEGLEKRPTTPEMANHNEQRQMHLLMSVPVAVPSSIFSYLLQV
jgi:hypothetical protein